MAWTKAMPLERLARDGAAVAKVGGRQVAVFRAGADILACNNRCPHEGYPLREGTLDRDCVLTCNWHNWKFDLRTGANLLGGDALRVYPTRVEDGAVWVDITDPPAAERAARARANLRAAFDDHEYDRIARELSRLAKAGDDPVGAVADAAIWSHDRLEFGMTHALAAAACWLRVHDESSDPELRLACLVEAIGHMAWDGLREAEHPYPTASAPWDEPAFLAAIEAQDEAQAVARLRGALDAGLGFAGVERALSTAALAHYADFGHALIYVVHAGALIARLGERVALPVLLALVRSLVYASREDLIPEFRSYAPALAAWNGVPCPAPDVSGPGAFRGRPVPDTLAAIVAARATPAPALHRALFGAGAADLLQFDTRWENQTDGSIAQNVGWLDFTHVITFANAARLQCAKFPELWPAALLQVGCFLGRNAAFTDQRDHLAQWRVGDRAAFEAASVARIVDHGEDLYIRSAHLLKTFLAARDEVAAGLPPEIETVTLAAVNRFLNTPPKRKHVRRTVRQAAEFVALED
ncbi:MAG: Rieske 2Fe-2S domain-containing protein [Alphaproteobacteria bacterium]|nr:Rieske 2Fe-2S domain-containing protein [Alphaproteobacteria bacterium]